MVFEKKKREKAKRKYSSVQFDNDNGMSMTRVLSTRMIGERGLYESNDNFLPICDAYKFLHLDDIYNLQFCFLIKM